MEYVIEVLVAYLLFLLSVWVWRRTDPTQRRNSQQMQRAPVQNPDSSSAGVSLSASAKHGSTTTTPFIRGNTIHGSFSLTVNIYTAGTSNEEDQEEKKKDLKDMIKLFESLLGDEKKLKRLYPEVNEEISEPPLF